MDTIGTDHVANNIFLKNIDADLWDVRAGFPGIGTMLPVMLSEGVNRGRIDIIRLSELCTTILPEFLDYSLKRAA